RRGRQHGYRPEHRRALRGVHHLVCFFFQAEDGIRDGHVTGVQTCALPILDLAELGQVQAPEEVDEQSDADRDAEEDLGPAQRPSWARTASIDGGTVAGRDADSSAVSGSFRPCPVRVSTTVEPGSTRAALTHLMRPATVAA